ncbi:MAG: hypothetical protein M3177_06570, partial [Pseudomonadota bacterium]|nr:hypothetical protein [Pseudomonadota bacterium]
HKVLGWAVWGSLSPGSLRLVLRTMIRARDFAVRNRYRDGVAYPWEPSLAGAAASEAPARSSAAVSQRREAETVA